jgi:S1-C subfamily serine protease
VGREAGGQLRAYGSGSGFVVDAQGLIVTNNHVVEGAPAIAIRLKSGERVSASVVRVDAANDLALLRADLPAGTPAVQLGDSERVTVGETAIAIGSPFGFEQTVTQGIVSALGRTSRQLIQTDAPINPGNSGGPLFNAAGEVIGVNTLIESPVRGSVGVGFAVPINRVKAFLAAP